ncbi:MAG: TRAP transporter TatT component family protein [Kiloniellales bacterium]|nr:TRAP transporter TatT component family protein [Kiloniellales bacterium]
MSGFFCQMRSTARRLTLALHRQGRALPRLAVGGTGSDKPSKQKRLRATYSLVCDQNRQPHEIARTSRWVTREVRGQIKSCIGGRHRSLRDARRFVTLGFVGSFLCSCSIEQTAVDYLADALSEGGSVYTSDDDPDLIREALPFGLKTYEGLLEITPEHRGLLLASAKGFTAYAYLLQDEADRIDAQHLIAARKLRGRARKLYLRGRDYALRGLAVSYEDFAAVLHKNPDAALSKASMEDVPYLYWSGVAWAGALSVAKHDLSLMADVALAAALVERSLDLDETYELGAAHEFFISYEGSRPGGSAQRARWHYAQALALSGGHRASVHLALAEAVAIQEQSTAEFRRLLDEALKVDRNTVTELRLVNTIAQRRALWLKSRVSDLFLIAKLEEGDQ